MNMLTGLLLYFLFLNHIRLYFIDSSAAQKICAQANPRRADQCIKHPVISVKMCESIIHEKHAASNQNAAENSFIDPSVKMIICHTVNFSACCESP